MLFHFLEGTNVGVDVEQMVARLNHQLDLDLFQSAWQRIADRHDVLRTRFRWQDVELPCQEVVDEITVDVNVIDRTTTNVDDRVAVVDEFLTEDRLTAVDMSNAPMWRVTLIQFSDDVWEMVFTYHHSLLDTSVVWILQEVFDTYDAAERGETTVLADRLPYWEHLAWLDTHRINNRPAAQSYYEELLAGSDGPLSLEALGTHDRSTKQTAGYRHDRFAVSGELSIALRDLAAQRGWGLAAAIEAVWAVVLGAFSGNDDIVFGSTRACRRSGVAGSEDSIGLFINTPPVRVKIDPKQTVAELVGGLRQQQTDKRAYEHTALADIQADVSGGRALFESIVVINDRHQGTRLKELGGAYERREFELHDQTNTPLNLLAFLDDTLHFKLSYDLRRFDEDRLDRVRELFIAVLEFVAEHPDNACADLPHLPTSDLEQLAAWNDTDQPVPGGMTIPLAFETQVDLTPDATAVVYHGASLTYAELDARSNSLAAHLIGLGIGPDSMVGILMNRSIDMMVALLGTLKAGGAYVPMDPSYPAERITMMLEDASAAVVVADPGLAAIVDQTSTTVVTLQAVPDGGESLRVSSGLVDSNLAYVIFTSGSTGRPKGVQIEHHNVINFFTAMDVALGHEPGEAPGVWLAVTSISFDISVLELFWTLTRGFTVIIQDDDSRLNDGTTTAAAATSQRVGPANALDFSLFYFAADSAESSGNRYRLLIDGAKFADQHGFRAVWTPERHFHGFGGNYPNPALTSAALAMVTDQIELRAGSVVLPLHNPIRCAEDWSVVDNLSGGRVGLSFASGWHANDFVLAPDNYENRRELMTEGIATIRSLWRGEAVTARGGDGRDVSVSLFPQPVQSDPPIWVTASGSPETFEMAGRLGASILTNLLVMSEDELAANTERYRAAFTAAGHTGRGHVSLMLHTFVGQDLDDVYDVVREPFLDYLKTSTNLIDKMQWEDTSFAKSAGGDSADKSTEQLSSLSEEDIAVLMDHAFQRYVRSAGLFGTPASCLETINRLAAVGVDEFACLIDFGIDDDTVLDHLQYLDELRQLANPTAGAEPDEAVGLVAESATDLAGSYGLLDNLLGAGVTHLQCTPSHASAIAATPEGLNSLVGLRQLLLGGEALPVVLANRLRSQLRGEMYNMYGPTETTIWSTVAPIVSAGQDITIGQPIANTRVQIVGKDLQQLPIGVAGELLIGGLGVVRGYLDRPELTSDRFISFDAEDGHRYYRTGDLARWTSDGRLEFLGRLDHQVKIRGHRIELGEIETAIDRDDRIAECVVVQRPGIDGEPQLVAYIVPSGDDASSTTAPSDVDWGEIWNLAYDPSNTVGTRSDATFDLAGWSDSYTGTMIPDVEMSEWVDLTVGRIMDLAPRRVLEVGCGTGLLLFRIAPHCERFVGVDLAQNALDRIGQTLSEGSVTNVELVRGAADSISDDVSGSFDTIVINSVAQYFPDADYLVGVVNSALAKLEPGGSLFLGDLRHRDLGRAFAAEIELGRAAPTTLSSELSARINERAERDSELLIDPALFELLANTMSEIATVNVQLKSGQHDNEMSRYRYDVVITRSNDDASQGVQPESAAPDATQPDVDVNSLESIVNGVRLAAAAGASSIVVRGIPNARLRRPLATLEMLDADHPLSDTAADTHSALDGLSPGIAPSALLHLVDAYSTALRWSTAGVAYFDLELHAPGQPTASIMGSAQALAPPTSWTSFSNRASDVPSPARTPEPSLVPALRAHLRSALPEFMVPTAFVELDRLPRTPNGKTDRKALPEPSASRIESAVAAVAADTDLEREIVDVWKGLLGLDEVGTETNVFDLGANSLLMVKASSQISARLGRQVTLVEMFEHPTIRSLATVLDQGSNTSSSDAPAESNARAESRAEKRRATRGRSRPTR